MNRQKGFCSHFRLAGELNHRFIQFSWYLFQHVWGFNSRKPPGLTSIILSNFKHLFWFYNGKVYFQILLSSETFPAVCARVFLHSRHFYFLHRRAVWHFLYGSQCRSKDSDLISDCDLCFLLRFSHGVQIACLWAWWGKRWCVYVSLCIWLCDISLCWKKRG